MQTNTNVGKSKSSWDDCSELGHPGPVPDWSETSANGFTNAAAASMQKSVHNSFFTPMMLIDCPHDDDDDDDKLKRGEWLIVVVVIIAFFSSIAKKHRKLLKIVEYQTYVSSFQLIFT